jgi:hypothetical protein
MKMNKGKLAGLVAGLGLIMASVFAAPPQEKSKAVPVTGDVFYIYTERGSRLNHFIPSGWMGDYGDLKYNPGWKEKVEKPKTKDSKKSKDPLLDKDETCIQLKYTAERKQGAGWAGIYWQHPANNWGDKRGGYDLSGFTKMTFWARGEAGGEMVDKFFIGGITGQTEEGDSDEASSNQIELTKDWKQYEIDLTGRDLSHIIGGLGFAVNAESNPNGLTMYIDEIKLVKGGKAGK